MEINGAVHCFFEQSGTFKNEFKKLGYNAYDYDIQNSFGETDYVIDLFQEIENAYDCKPSIYDKIGGKSLIIAFFPCIYFETLQQCYYTLNSVNLKKSIPENIEIVLDRIEKRTKFHKILYKMYALCYKRNLRMIIENPATQPNYLMTGQNFPPPTFVDNNRLTRGDYFSKPTAYWFVNCYPTYGFSMQRDKQAKRVEDCKSGVGGICNTERSMISPDYARNFICDFIIGKRQRHSIPTLF